MEFQKGFLYTLVMLTVQIQRLRWERRRRYVIITVFLWQDYCKGCQTYGGLWAHLQTNETDAFTLQSATHHSLFYGLSYNASLKPSFSLCGETLRKNLCAPTNNMLLTAELLYRCTYLGKCSNPWSRGFTANYPGLKTGSMFI